MRKKGTGTLYRIVARSELGDRYASAFDGMRMETKDGETILTGEVKDQPHLFGILDRINGLGLELLSVQAIPDDGHQRAERGLEPKSLESSLGYGFRQALSGPGLDQQEEDEMLRVLVVDDLIDFRQAFVALLEGQPDLKVVSQAGSLAEARTMMEGIDVVLLDRGLPDGDGLELLGPLREANPSARVLVMSSSGEMRHPGDAIGAGADGVIDKLAPFERTFALIRGEGPARGPSSLIHRSA